MSVQECNEKSRAQEVVNVKSELFWNLMRDTSFVSSYVYM